MQLSDIMPLVCLTLYGDPRTKKNNTRVFTKGDKVRVLPSEAYERYEHDCIKQVTGSAKRLIMEPVQVRYVYYMKTRRAVDLVNLIEATNDILVRAGVLGDDNNSIIVGHDGSRVKYDKDNPRVEVTITKAMRGDLDDED